MANGGAVSALKVAASRPDQVLVLLHPAPWLDDFCPCHRAHLPFCAFEQYRLFESSVSTLAMIIYTPTLSLLHLLMGLASEGRGAAGAIAVARAQCGGRGPKSPAEGTSSTVFPALPIIRHTPRLRLISMRYLAFCVTPKRAKYAVL